MAKLIFTLYLSLSLIPSVSSAIDQTARQDVTAITPVVEAFLRSQAAPPPEQSKVMVSPPDPRLDLPACPKLEVFLPAGARLQGRVTVGVRCLEPSPWVIYVQAQISTLTRHLVAAVPLAQGHVITESDLTMAADVLGASPAGLMTDSTQAIGRTVATPIAAGSPIRPNQFRKDWVVRQGQAIRLSTAGAGFRISVEAKAMANASEGEPVQVKTKSGRLLMGTARPGGVVEMAR
ncbi:MAG: flagellar basal body P-ring formation chaperone FlgA [Candidatus Methylumidiphilus sp.]